MRLPLLFYMAPDSSHLQMQQRCSVMYSSGAATPFVLLKSIVCIHSALGNWRLDFIAAGGRVPRALLKHGNPSVLRIGFLQGPGASRAYVTYFAISQIQTAM